MSGATPSKKIYIIEYTENVDAYRSRNEEKAFKKRDEAHMFLKDRGWYHISEVTGRHTKEDWYMYFGNEGRKVRDRGPYARIRGIDLV